MAGWEDERINGYVDGLIGELLGCYVLMNRSMGGSVGRWIN